MHSDTDLYIIAAGKGSRMGGSLPKALVPIFDGEPNITTTLKQAAGKFSNVFVVTNEQIQEDWAKYFATLPSELGQNVHQISITSGLGDGHAVLAAFSKVRHLNVPTIKQSEDVVICWGDAFIQYEETFTEILSKNLWQMTSSGVIPAVREENPYVTLLVDPSMKCRSADFSKYGESHPSGFHDQSLFRFKRESLINALVALNCALWKNGRYMTPGNELSLLYAFHYLYNIGDAASVFETDYPTLSFNTPDEVASIQKEISEKWKRSQS